MSSVVIYQTIQFAIMKENCLKDDNIYTVDDDPNTLLNRANSLHKNLQFSIKKAKEKSELAF